MALTHADCKQPCTTQSKDGDLINNRPSDCGPSPCHTDIVMKLLCWFWATGMVSLNYDGYVASTRCNTRQLQTVVQDKVIGDHDVPESLYWL